MSWEFEGTSVLDFRDRDFDVASDDIFVLSHREDDVNEDADAMNVGEEDDSDPHADSFLIEENLR